MKNNTKYKLVLIEWEDSVLGYQGWKFIEDEPRELTSFISVGFLVHEDKKCKILFPHIDSTQKNITGAGDIKIPCSAIRKMIVLEY
jgi:hypothetical protein